MKIIQITLLSAALVLSAACGGQETPAAGEPETSTVPPVAEPLVTDTTPAQPDTSAGATILVLLEDNAIGMPTEDLAPGPLVFTVRNGGTQVHGFSIEGGETKVQLAETLSPGGEASLSTNLTAGTYRAFCQVHVTDPSGIAQGPGGESVEFRLGP